MCREVGNGLQLVYLWAGNPICTPIPDLTWESAELPRPRARALPFTSPWPCAEGPSCPARRVRCCQPVRFCSARSGVTVLLPAPCLRLAPLAAVGWGGVGLLPPPGEERSWQAFVLPAQRGGRPEAAAAAPCSICPLPAGTGAPAAGAGPQRGGGGGAGLPAGRLSRCLRSASAARAPPAVGNGRAARGRRVPAAVT